MEQAIGQALQGREVCARTEKQLPGIVSPQEQPSGQNPEHGEMIQEDL